MSNNNDDLRARSGNFLPLLVSVALGARPDLHLFNADCLAIGEIEALVGALPLDGGIGVEDPLLVGVAGEALVDLDLGTVGICATDDIETFVTEQSQRTVNIGPVVASGSKVAGLGGDLNAGGVGRGGQAERTAGVNMLEVESGV